MSSDQHGVEGKTRRNIYAIYYWILGGLLALLILGVTLSPKPQKVPPELQGVWRTGDPNYSDRTFEVSSISLTFGTGQGTSSTGFIRHVKVEQMGSDSLYTITYASDEGENRVSLRYDPANHRYFSSIISLPSNGKESLQTETSLLRQWLRAEAIAFPIKLGSPWWKEPFGPAHVQVAHKSRSAVVTALFP